MVFVSIAVDLFGVFGLQFELVNCNIRLIQQLRNVSIIMVA